MGKQQDRDGMTTPYLIENIMAAMGLATVLLPVSNRAFQLF
jgi:hypothetical protein